MSQIADPNTMALLMAQQSQLANNVMQAPQQMGMEGARGAQGAPGIAGLHQQFIAKQQMPRPAARGGGSPLHKSVQDSKLSWNPGNGIPLYGSPEGEAAIAAQQPQQPQQEAVSTQGYQPRTGGYNGIDTRYHPELDHALGQGQGQPETFTHQHQQNELALQKLQLQEGQQKVDAGNKKSDTFGNSINANIEKSIAQQHSDEEQYAGRSPLNAKGGAGKQQDWKGKNEQGLSQLDHITKLKDHIDKQLDNVMLPDDQKAQLQAQSNDLHNQSMGLYHSLYGTPNAAVAPKAAGPDQSRYTGDPNNPTQGLPQGNGQEGNANDLKHQAIAQQYLQAFGGDREKAQAAMAAQGWK